MSQPVYGDPDGFGVYGVLQQSDDGLLIRCHDCGEWYAHLGLHAAHVHDGAADYRERHGLKRTRGLVADSIRTKQVQNGTRISASPAGQALAQARDPRRAARIWREMGAPVSAEAARERDQRMSAVGKACRKGTVTVCAEYGVEFCALVAASKRRYCDHSCANRANRRAPRQARDRPIVSAWPSIEQVFHTGGMAGGSGRGVEHHVPAPPSARSHVWVQGPPGTHGPVPGLILRWDRGPTGAWRALTVFYLEEQETLVQQWLDASMLTPVAWQTRR